MNIVPPPDSRDPQAPLPSAPWTRVTLRVSSLPRGDAFLLTASESGELGIILNDLMPFAAGLCDALARAQTLPTGGDWCVEGSRRGGLVVHGPAGEAEPPGKLCRGGLRLLKGGRNG